MLILVIYGYLENMVILVGGTIVTLVLILIMLILVIILIMFDGDYIYFADW